MAVTQADVDALNEAIALGVRQATIGGQTVLYQTSASLIQARDDMAAQLKKANPPTERRSKQISAYHAGRGFD